MARKRKDWKAKRERSDLAIFENGRREKMEKIKAVRLKRTKVKSRAKSQ